MKHCFLCTLFIVHGLVCYGQEYERGLIFDDAAYDGFEMIFPEISRSYAALPEQISLKPFCPYPQRQKGGTCVAWASAYAARTISDAILYNWTSRSKITQEAFSPDFLYFYIKNGLDTRCSMGSQINDAINQMTIRGIPKYTDFQVSCTRSIPLEVQKKAKSYRIAGGASLYRSSDYSSFKIESIKRALSQNKPVITAITCPPSFDTPIGDQWIPRSSENPAYPFTKNGEQYGGHALCIIGYDDSKYGGAFEIMNSWGDDWGDKGYVWVSYSNFMKWQKYSYIIYPNNSTPVENKYAFSSNIQLTLNAGALLALTKETKPATIATYITDQKMVTGTQYRIYLSNNAPCYVYLIGGDDSGAVVKLFPNNETISAYLPYSNSSIAIPGERYTIRATEPAGNDYLLVLYSDKPLDLEQYIIKLKNQSGSFNEKVNGLSMAFAPTSNISFSPKNISFQSKLNLTKLGVLIKILR
ncbi:MAG: DUF4384 domain-containing protein [Saprospiraceae bacterium]|nr:DUF4384 domain-containing protein [Saprospiraceae bacterium]